MGQEVITIESQAWKSIMFNIERAMQTTEQIARELRQVKEDRWMTLEEVAEFTGFKSTWITARKRDLGGFKQGKGLRFKKSKVDQYMEEHSYQINRDSDATRSPKKTQRKSHSL